MFVVVCDLIVVLIVALCLLFAGLVVTLVMWFVAVVFRVVTMTCFVSLGYFVYNVCFVVLVCCLRGCLLDWCFVCGLLCMIVGLGWYFIGLFWVLVDYLLIVL